MPSVICRRLLNRLQITLGIRSAVGVWRGERTHLDEDGFFVHGVLVGQHLVDADDAFRQRPEPREFGIVQERLQEFVSRESAMDTLVPTALPLEQGAMQAQERLADVTQAHDALGVWRGHGPSVTRSRASWSGLHHDPLDLVRQATVPHVESPVRSDKRIGTRS